MEKKTFSPREISAFEGVLKLAAEGQDLRLLKVQDIANAAGMGKGTLYEYFRSKEEILLGTILYVARQELDLLEAMADSFADFDDLFAQTMDYVRQLIDRRASSYLMVANSMASPAVCTGNQLFAAELKRLETLFCRGLALGQSCGRIRQDCSLDFFSYTMTTAIMAHAHALMMQNSGCCHAPLDPALTEQYTLSIIQRSLG